MKTILITGFEPFDGHSLNPSAEVAKQLDGEEIADRRIIGRVLPLDYRTMVSVIERYVDEFSPSVIVLMGQSNRGSVTIERMAVNAVSTEREDNKGYKPENDFVSSSGPVGYFSNVDVNTLARKLRERGFSVFTSYHAGTYGCNFIFYRVLAMISEGVLDAKVLFVHVPPLPAQAIEKQSQSMPNMGLDELVETIRALIQEL